MFDTGLSPPPMFAPPEEVIDCLVEDQPGAAEPVRWSEYVLDGLLVDVLSRPSDGQQGAPAPSGMNSYEARLVGPELKAIWAPGVGTTLLGRRPHPRPLHLPRWTTGLIKCCQQ